MIEPLRLTRLTNTRGALTKRYSLDADGSLRKTTAAALYEGRAELVECAGLEAYMNLRAALRSNEALAYGITGRASVGLTTQRALRDNPAQAGERVARDAGSFHYPRGPGVLMLDHDAEHLPESYDRESLRAALLSAVPELAGAPMAWCTSASSHIVNADTGAQLQGLRGQRLYVALADATDIPRVGRIIYECLWSAGIGTFVVSKAGTLLDRNLVDASAWQPERIDFAAGAECTPPLEQRAPEWHLWEAPGGGFEPWDSRAVLPELTAEQSETAAAHRAAARARMAERAGVARSAFIDERASTLSEARGVEPEEARRMVLGAVEQRLLFAEWLLHPEEGDPVTVGQVLDDPARWHGTRFADPLEPDYRGDRRIAWANMRSGGRPYLFSHAHGLAQRYELLRQPAQLMVLPGDLARLTDDCLRVVRERGELYDFGTADIARVAEGRVYLVTRGYMLDYLGRHIRFTRFDSRARKGEEIRPTDCPQPVAHAIVDRVGERELPKLRGVITAPTLRADGSALDLPGFDSATGLLYACDDPMPPRVPARPSREDVIEALRVLMEPVAGFPFASPEARSVALAALLTACVRRSLPTAPGFAIDAPTPGTGKSLLAKVVLALGGHSTASHKPPPSDEECGKVLFAALREGAGAIFLDNYSTPIGGPAIDHFLTADEYAGRVLGSSVNAGCLPNGALMLFTGNNIDLMGDTCRRVLTCRLDARVEHPSRRAFGFDPVQFVKARRPGLVRAALTLMRGYLTSSAAPKGRPLGSFEVWDALVRQTVCWLADIQPAVELGDPNATSEAAEGEDEGKGQLAELLRAWADAFKDTPITAQAALEFCQQADFCARDDPVSLRKIALSQAFDALKRHPREVLTAKRLGQYLKANKDKPAGSRRFEGYKDRTDTMRWFATGSAQGNAGIEGYVSPPKSENVRAGLPHGGQRLASSPSIPANPGLVDPVDLAAIA